MEFQTAEGKAHAELIPEMIADPETDAYTFVASGSDGSVMTFGQSGGDEETFREIAATIFIQFASASEKDESEFLKSVISEYNARKQDALAEYRPPEGEA